MGCGVSKKRLYTPDESPHELSVVEEEQIVTEGASMEEEEVPDIQVERWYPQVERSPEKDRLDSSEPEECSLLLTSIYNIYSPSCEEEQPKEQSNDQQEVRPIHGVPCFDEDLCNCYKVEWEELRHSLDRQIFRDLSSKDLSQRAYLRWHSLCDFPMRVIVHLHHEPGVCESEDDDTTWGESIIDSYVESTVEVEGVPRRIRQAKTLEFMLFPYRALVVSVPRALVGHVEYAQGTAVAFESYEKRIHESGHNAVLQTTDIESFAVEREGKPAIHSRLRRVDGKETVVY